MGASRPGCREVLMPGPSALVSVFLAATCLVAAGCAGPNARDDRIQQVLLQTDPLGATCTVARDGAVVATVEATPGAATVERRSDPIEVTCTRAGYVEHQESFASEASYAVERDEGVERERSSAETAAGTAAAVASISAAQAAATVASASSSMVGA